MLAEAIAKGSCRAEWTRKHADGHLIPVELTLILAVIDGKTYVITYYHDISSRVHMRRERDALLASLTTRLDTLVQRVAEELKASSDALTADAAALASGLHTSSEQLARAAAGSEAASSVVATIAAATEQLSGSTALVMDQVSSRRAVTQATVAESEAVSATVAIGRIGATILQLTVTAESMGQAVEEQGRATQEIARSTAHAAQGVSEAAAGITQVVALTQQSESVAEEVRVRAGALDAEVVMLRTEVEHFRSQPSL